MSFTQVLTGQVQAFAGMQNGLNKNMVRPGLNEEASAELAFGTLCAQGSSDDGILKPAAQANVASGVLQQSHALVKNPGTGVFELGSTGLAPKAVGDVAEFGELWVKTDETVTPASAVRAYMSGASAGTFRASSSAGVTVDFSDRAKWAGTYSSGFALLKFDFRIKKAGAAD